LRGSRRNVQPQDEKNLLLWHSYTKSANNHRLATHMLPWLRRPSPTSGAYLVKFRPLHDRVVVRRLTAEAKTSGGIIIPDTAQEKPMEGEVVAAGPGARDDKGQIVALMVKEGDRVLFGKWSGTEVKLDGEELLIMKESDLMGVVEGQKKAA
jgi:chaperonin GroES